MPIKPWELAEKVKELDPAEFPGLDWHFIGHLQTNKLKMVLDFCPLKSRTKSFHFWHDRMEWQSLWLD